MGFQDKMELQGLKERIEPARNKGVSDDTRGIVRCGASQRIYSPPLFYFITPGNNSQGTEGGYEDAKNLAFFDVSGYDAVSARLQQGSETDYCADL